MPHSRENFSTVMKPYKLYRALHGRGETLKSLASKARLAPTQLSMMFNGQRGANSRKHVAPHLTDAERGILGWDQNGNLVPHGTTSQV